MLTHRTYKHVEKAKLNYCIHLCLNNIPIVNDCVSKLLSAYSLSYLSWLLVTQLIRKKIPTTSE